MLTEQSIKNFLDVFSESWGTIVILLGVLGIGIDITPWIKINPMRKLMGCLGKLLYADIEKQQETILKDVKNLSNNITSMQSTIDNNRVKELRRYILDFANSLTKRIRDKEEYSDIDSAIIEYNELVEKYAIKNGKIHRAVDKINKFYQIEEDHDWKHEEV